MDDIRVTYGNRIRTLRKELKRIENKSRKFSTKSRIR